jgi:hypothetical protein
MKIAGAKNRDGDLATKEARLPNEKENDNKSPHGGTG